MKTKFLYIENISKFSKKHIGKKIITYFGNGIVKQTKFGPILPFIKCYCWQKGCRRYVSVFVYQGPAGPGQYACDKNGKYLANLRDVAYYCTKHKRGKKKLPTI